MTDHENDFSPSRFLLLTLAFVTAAVFAYSLSDTLFSAGRYVIMPGGTADTFLPAFLPSPYDGMLAEVLGQVRQTALEMLVWFAGGLTVIRMPVFVLLSLGRGISFGFVLSLLLRGDGTLLGGSPVLLAGYGLATLVLLVFASRIFPRRRGKPVSAGYGLQFLVCAGLVCCVTAACRML